MKIALTALVMLLSSQAFASSSDKVVTCYDQMPNPSFVVSIEPSDDDNYFNIRSVAVANDPRFKKIKDVGMYSNSDAGSKNMEYFDILTNGRTVYLSVDKVNLTGVLVLPKVFHEGGVVLEKCTITTGTN